jgi:hypothetical protein
MLIDRYLPIYDVTQVCETRIHASPDEAYHAIAEADLRDPVISALFALRELPMRLTRRLRGEPPPVPPTRITFGSITREGPGWVVLAEEPGSELVIGSVGRFWQKDYGGRPVSAEEFASFAEPGFAKLAIGFSVRPDGLGGTVLKYEARTATTDATAYRHFHRYWRLIRPGVALVMRSALHRIKLEAELEAVAV